MYMTDFAKRIVYWTPRALCIAFALFISIFSFDVFGGGRGFWTTALALLLHLIPTAVILAVLAISWRREWVGSVIFTLLGILYIVWAWGRLPWPAHIMVAGPLILIGILFWINWHNRKGALVQR